MKQLKNKLLYLGIFTCFALLIGLKTQNLLALGKPLPLHVMDRQALKQYIHQSHDKIAKLAEKKPRKKIKTLVSLNKTLGKRELQKMLSSYGIKKVSKIYHAQGDNRGALELKKGEDIDKALKRLNQSYNHFLNVAIKAEKNPKLNQKFQTMKKNNENIQIYGIEIFDQAKKIQKLSRDPQVKLIDKLSFYDKKIPLYPDSLK